MKRSLIILILIPLSLWSGTKDTLPIANSIILDFIEDNIGKIVGAGSCHELVLNALNRVDNTWALRSEEIWMYGRRIKSRDVIPGDIIRYNNVKMKNGIDLKNHIAIVYRVLDKKKFLVAEQNVANSKDFVTWRDSKVMINEENLRNKKIGRGTIKFYRPY